MDPLSFLNFRLILVSVLFCFPQDVASNRANGECGGVLTPIYGFLAYKDGSNLETNERCVWIIRAPGARRYMIRAISIGFTNDTQLIVTGLGLGRVANNTNHAIISENGSIAIMEHSNVLIVTLSRGDGDELDSMQKGFKLEYSVLANAEASIELPSSQSKNYLLNVNLPNTIEHPGRGLYYSSLELTIFLIGPKNNIFRRGQPTNVYYAKKNIEGSCYDHLDVFKFTSDSPLSWKWEYVTRICGDVETTEFENDDLIMIAFETDSSSNYNGFQLGYQNGCPKEKRCKCNDIDSNLYVTPGNI